MNGMDFSSRLTQYLPVIVQSHDRAVAKPINATIWRST